MITFSIPPFSYPGCEFPLFEEQIFSLTHGAWTALKGPSGCGKSTLFKILAGFIQNTPRHDIALLTQTATLFPWLSLASNIGLSDTLQGCSLQKEKIHHLLHMMGLWNDRDKKPRELSFGMQRRILLARTLYMDRPIIFLDEPFSALDPQTRHTLYEEAKTWLQAKTVFFITHHDEEADVLGDFICELKGRPGKIIKNDLVTRKIA